MSTFVLNQFIQPMIAKLLMTILLLSALAAEAQHPPLFEGIQTDTTYIALGDFNVNLVKYSYRSPNINFLVIHDDEDTGLKAAIEYIHFSGGTVIDPQYGGVRNYNFNYNAARYQIDPNSIYTEEGIRKGLAKYGAFDDLVVSELLKASKVILNSYSPGKPDYVFTLHNNTDGRFAITSYLKGYELENTADSVFINFQMDSDDFILVTDPALFSLLKRENVNVVLQGSQAPDDGSLSIYAMQNQIPYLNVEVQHGHQNVHLQLIEVAIKSLRARYPALQVRPVKTRG
jgi:hypothetical protein